ncbi:MAG: S8 family peptidase [Limisphaerales bacterium]
MFYFAEAAADISLASERKSIALDVTENRVEGSKMGDGSQTRREGRRVPEVVAAAELGKAGLAVKAVPLVEAEMLRGARFAARKFGRVETERGPRWFHSVVVLVKFREAKHVAALVVERQGEVEAVRALRSRKDVVFAELDFIQERQFSPNDPMLLNQWHHGVIGSFAAWGYSLGEPSVRVAIVDTPFQMDHPDLAAHTDAGWDVVNGTEITFGSAMSAGIEHSTLSAGMTAAVIGNGVGAAGASNCRILPININGSISEMYAAIVWAADNGVRVVNISWTGADSESLNAAGAYLKEKTRGVLVMPGVNGSGFLNYTNQPNIYCVSMTDAADNVRSRFGNHIDFAAPGWEIFSTTTNSGYAFGTGTSFSAPLFCGVVATLFTINPTMDVEAAIKLLKDTAMDLGAPGWDQFYGHGRIDFGAAAAAADASRPRITEFQISDGRALVTVSNAADLDVLLWRSSTVNASSWEAVPDVSSSVDGGLLTLVDPNPAENQKYYRVEVRLR